MILFIREMGRDSVSGVVAAAVVGEPVVIKSGK
jgi:hypothetical protein